MTDETIIKLLIARDSSALEELQQRYTRYCAAIISSLISDQQEAEQLLNDTWMQVWTSIPPNRPEHLRLYVGRIARNLTLNRLDYLNAQKRAAPLEELCAVTPDRNLDRQALRTALEQFLRQQRPEHRQIFLRRYWYGEEVRQIAKQLGCTRTRVSGILFRMRGQLKEYLEREDLYEGI